MQAKQEKWDLYDQQGRKTGKTIQAGENVPYGYCLYCVGIWVIDSEKKILLTKRSSQKRYAPGKWENTGGHMISGETSRHAIVRELKEETGIQIEEDELIELGDNHIGQFLGDNYAVFKDVALDEVHLEEGETEDVIKVTLLQLEEMAEKKINRRFGEKKSPNVSSSLPAIRTLGLHMPCKSSSRRSSRSRGLIPEP